MLAIVTLFEEKLDSTHRQLYNLLIIQVPD